MVHPGAVAATHVAVVTVKAMWLKTTNAALTLLVAPNPSVTTTAKENGDVAVVVVNVPASDPPFKLVPGGTAPLDIEYV